MAHKKDKRVSEECDETFEFDGGHQSVRSVAIGQKCLCPPDSQNNTQYNTSHTGKAATVVVRFEATMEAAHRAPRGRPSSTPHSHAHSLQVHDSIFYIRTFNWVLKITFTGRIAAEGILALHMKIDLFKRSRSGRGAVAERSRSG